MKVNINDIVINNKIGKGTFSNVYSSNFNNKEYSLKLLKEKYPTNIINTLSNLTEINFKKQFITPIYLVENNFNDILGYLSYYNKDLISMDKINDLRVRIKLLKDMKKNIILLHKKYEIIHSDLLLTNMLFDIENEKSYIIDFDSSLKPNSKNYNKSYLRLITENYLEKFGLDYNLDTYLFNISTLMAFYNYNDTYHFFEDLKKERINIENKNIRKLSKELLLKSNKDYSGEYIIDYL